MNRKWFNGFFIATLILAMFTVIACEGITGPAGKDGKDGKEDQTGIYTVTFDLNGGRIEGNSTIAIEKVVSGGKAHRPERIPVREAGYSELLSGLYKTVKGLAPMAFNGWYYNNILWDFDANTITENTTLRAGWIPADPIDIGGTNIPAAVTYVNRNTESEFILVLDTTDDIILTSTQTITGGAKLTIIGSTRVKNGNGPLINRRTPVRISRNSNGASFTVSSSSYETGSSSLTIGNYITLAGRDSNNSSVINVTNGAHFIMERGSEISGNTITYNTYASAVNISGAGSTFHMKGGTITNNATTGSGTSNYGAAVYLDTGGTFVMDDGLISNNISTISIAAAVCIINGTFTMSAGEITGNRTRVTGTAATGGVYVTNLATSIFVMKGGSITGNTRANTATGSTVEADVHINCNNSSNTDANFITLSGRSTIGALTLEAYYSYFPHIKIPSALTGSVGLNLRSNSTVPESVSSSWTGKPIVRTIAPYNITLSDIDRFTLGNFYTTDTATSLISNTHSLNTTRTAAWLLDGI